MGWTDRLGGMRELIRRRGLRGAVARAGERLAPWTKWRDEFIFYELDLGGTDARPASFDGDLRFRAGSSEDAALLEQLPRDVQVTTMTPEVVARRLRSGAMLWLVTEGDRLAFSCWTFLGSAPLTGAQDREHPLPEGVVLLEDSISSPLFRGRGVAPAAWAAVAAAHAERGERAMVTKVAEGNHAVRRALEKAGFQQVARMHRSGPVWRMRVVICDADGAPVGHWLAGVATA